MAKKRACSKSVWGGKQGRCKSWTPDSGLDRGLDRGLDGGPDFGPKLGPSFGSVIIACFV